MAKYANNNWFLSIDGTDVSAYLQKITLSPKADTQETTAGSGTDNRTRVVGLIDHSISFDIIYDDAAAWALTLIAPGEHAIIYGKEGNGTGNPKHVQSFIFTGMPHTTDVNKAAVVYSVSGDAAGAPSTDMFAGGVWS